MTFLISKCAPTEGPAIAAVYLSTITPFLRYQFGSASFDDLLANFADQYTHVLEGIQQGRPDKVYLKVVDNDMKDEKGEGTMIAWADWELPEDESKWRSSGGLPLTPPKGINDQFCGRACLAVEIMRNRVLTGRKCYVLNQLVTLPSHQRRGAGSMLISWGIERADTEGLVCYLDAELDGGVVKLYEKMGFVKVDECQVSLFWCGLEGAYTHVAMVREPKGRNGEAKLEDVLSNG